MTDLNKNKKINLLIEDMNIMSSSSLVDSMVEMFYQRVVSEADSRLLTLAFKKEITQKDLDEFVKSWDIEVYGSAKSLILSYIKKDNPHLKFTDYEGPRLSGLLNYHRFSNLKLISHYTKYVRELNKHNITPMLIKGGAMKYLRPDLPRVMGDTDIVTKFDEFDTACDVASELGYEFGIDSTVHSVDLHPAGTTEGSVDVHRFIDFDADYDTSFMNELFERGSTVKAFGTHSIIPSYEDLVFISLTNMSKNLHRKTSVAGTLFVLFDCKYLVDNKPDFNWDLVLENAIKTNTTIAVFFAMSFINKLVPSMLPKEIFENKSMVKNVEKYCNDVIFFRFYVHDLKMRCKVLKIKDALTNFDKFKQYLSDKPKHFVLKRVGKSPVLVALFLKVYKKIGK